MCLQSYMCFGDSLACGCSVCVLSDVYDCSGDVESAKWKRCDS